MALVMMRMRLDLLRRSTRGGFVNWKSLIGLFLALWTCSLAVVGSVDARVVAGTVALLMLVWTIGWILGPIQTGASDDATLLPEYFAFLPIAPSRLALGTLVTRFIGPGGIVTGVAVFSVVLLGLQFGAIPALVAIPAAILQLVFMVVLSNVTTGALSSTMRTAFGLELAALQWSAFLALAFVGWTVPVVLADDGELAGGFGTLLDADRPDIVTTVVLALPTGWGLAAVDAARLGDWLVVLLALAGLLLVIGLLLAAWSRFVQTGLHQQSTRTAASTSSLHFALWRRVLPRTPLGAATGRELLLWSREPRNALEVRTSILSALFIVLIPAAVGVNQLMPWAGVVVLFLAGLGASNVYGLEGTAIWSALMVPGGEREDVRGKQLAFLLVFGPAVLLLTAVFILLSGHHDMWVWVIPIIVAMAGGAAGTMIAASARGAVPVPETARRSGDLMAAADNTGAAWLTMALVVLSAVPAAAVVAGGQWTGNPALSWLGVPVGLVTAILSIWAGQRVATSYLVNSGPELLAHLKHGARADEAKSTDDEKIAEADAGMAGGLRGALAIVLWSTFWIPLSQAGTTIAFEAFGDGEAWWAIPYYLPDVLKWLAVILLLALSAAMVGTAWWIQRQHETDHADREMGHSGSET